MNRLDNPLGVVIYQEGNPLPISIAVSKLILSDESYVKASKDQKRLIG